MEQPQLETETKQTVEEVEQSKAPNRVRYEIFREADDTMVIIKTGQISKKKAWLITNKRRYATNHILKITKTEKRKNKEITKTRYLIRWNEAYSEAIGNLTDLVPQYDQMVENQRAQQFGIQIKDAAITLTGMLQLDRTMTLILCLAMVFGIPIGLNFNAIFNWVPNTVVHWVP